jgi:hypothetical protein
MNRVSERDVSQCAFVVVDDRRVHDSVEAVKRLHDVTQHPIIDVRQKNDFIERN